MLVTTDQLGTADVYFLGRPLKGGEEWDEIATKTPNIASLSMTPTLCMHLWWWVLSKYRKMHRHFGIHFPIQVEAQASCVAISR